MSQYFLAKSGQTFGPYTEAEIEALRDRGEYENYTWFWSSERNQWEAIDPPPAPPKIARTAEVHAPVREATTPVAQPVAPSISNESAQGLHVVCYDHHSVLSGRLQNVTDSGCDFFAETEASAPLFQLKVPVFVNLLDPKSGRSMSVSARVAQVGRKQGRWQYRLHWKRCPELMRAAA